MLKQDIKILSLEDIRETVDCAEKVLDVPEWNGAVRLKAWSLEERDRVIALSTDTGKLDGKMDTAKLIHLCVIYGVIEPKLTEEIIRRRSWQVIDRIATAVMELNGLIKGAALTASATFRPESGPAVSDAAGEGSGEGAGAAAP